MATISTAVVRFGMALLCLGMLAGGVAAEEPASPAVPLANCPFDSKFHPCRSLAPRPTELTIGPLTDFSIANLSTWIPIPSGSRRSCRHRPILSRFPAEAFCATESGN